MTRQVWRRDLRFGDLLPGVDATVHDIAISGHQTHERDLLKTLPKLERRLDEFGRESRDEALIRYLSTNTGQSRQRTTTLLQSLGLLEPTITRSEAGRQLGVSPNGSTSSLDRYGTASIWFFKLYAESSAYDVTTQKLEKEYKRLVKGTTDADAERAVALLRELAELMGSESS